MELSIIITSYRNPELLKVCINSIKRSLALSEYQIIVSDCQPTEEITLMMKEEFPEVDYLTSDDNLYYGGEVRQGYAKSRGEYLLILNDDIIVKKGAVEKMMEHMKANPEIGVVGPQLLNFNETVQPSCFRFPTPLTIIYRRTFLGKMGFAKRYLGRYLMNDSDFKEVREVDWIMGSAILVRKKAIEKVGLFDERFVVYFEDTDWCRRFWENGYKVIYLPQAQMYHYHRRGSAGKGILKLILFNKLTRLHILSAVKYFMKYAGKPLPRHN